MSLSAHSSFDVSEDRSLLPWLDESSTAPLLRPQADCTNTSADLVVLDSPEKPTPRPDSRASPSLAPAAPPGLSVPSVASPSLQPPSPTSPSTLPVSPTSPAQARSPEATSSQTLTPTAKAAYAPVCTAFSAPTPRNIELELRATVDALLQRKKDAQRGLVAENASLREEVGFLRNTLRLSSPSSPSLDSEDSDAKQLAAALAHERAERLRSEEKLQALVLHLSEQVTAGAERRTAVEKALLVSERDCTEYQDKLAAAMVRCEVLEEENLRVKSLLGVYARQRPGVVQQQVQGMLREVAEDRANLKRLEAIEPILEKTGRPEVKKSGALSYGRRGTKKTKGYAPVQTTELCWSNLADLDE
ncbi:hypothetical protein C8Q77DRAFT_542526 [Trametes polyzona]|nr:hypothetical protein C8Q77DRAFT_542526 [Trametes polyzona]